MITEIFDNINDELRASFAQFLNGGYLLKPTAPKLLDERIQHAMQRLHPTV